MSLLVIPRTQTVEGFRPDRSPVVLRGATRVDLSDILEGLGFVVADLFAALRLD